MTYDVGVWVSSRRVRPEEAGAIYARLCEGDTSDVEPSARISAFVRELTAKYPQIDDVPDEKVDDCPWSIAFDQSAGHVIMPMSYSRVEEVVPFVMQLAAKHGLVFYDASSDSLVNPR